MWIISAVSFVRGKWRSPGPMTTSDPQYEISHDAYQRLPQQWMPEAGNWSSIRSTNLTRSSSQRKNRKVWTQLKGHFRVKPERAWPLHISISTCATGERWFLCSMIRMTSLRWKPLGSCCRIAKSLASPPARYCWAAGTSTASHSRNLNIPIQDGPHSTGFGPGCIF